MALSFKAALGGGSEDVHSCRFKWVSRGFRCMVSNEILLITAFVFNFVE